MPVAARRVALLRGVNVGSAKRIAMADLRRLMEALGFTDVRTILNSGNVVFTLARGTTDAPAPLIERAIADRLGVDTRVTVLTGDELSRATGENPLASVATDPARTLIMALQDGAAASRLRPLLAQAWTPEALALRGRIAYLWCAGGIAESPLWSAVGRRVGDAGTARNLSTMARIVAVVASPTTARGGEVTRS